MLLLLLLLLLLLSDEQEIDGTMKRCHQIKIIR